MIDEKKIYDIDVDKNKRLAEIFLEEKRIVHVSKKDRGQFYNGPIIKVGSDFFVVNDKVEGERFVLFGELSKDLETFISKGDGE